MSTLLYWILFSILLTLLVIFFSYLVLNVIFDYCVVNTESLEKRQANEHDIRLNKYQFDKDDVEDLTRIQGNFKTALPKVSLTNEVEKSSVDGLLKKKVHTYSSLSNIDEEDVSKHSLHDLHSISSTLSTVEDNATKAIEKTTISQSVDNLEFCDPEGIDVLKEIHRIEDEAKKIDGDLEYFIGSTSDVKYYEINEELLRLMIALCDIKCESDDMRRKKTKVLDYIEGCKKRLRLKAMGAL